MNQQQQRRVNEAAEQFADALRGTYQAAIERSVSAQEVNAELTQEFFNRVVENLRTQAEDARQMGQQLTDQQQRATEAGRTLTRESVDAYKEFMNSLLSYLGGLEISSKLTQRKMDSSERDKQEAIRLLEEWLADESGYDEETWPELKAALDRDRPSARKLFVD